MKKRILLVIKTLVFLAILGCVLFTVSLVTERKSSYKKNHDFFEEAKDDHLDVIFLGSSHVINGINPIRLYEKYGITSYNLGGHGSLLKESYWQLIRSLDYCKPDYVVVDCYMMDRNYEYIDKMYEDTPENLRSSAISQLHLNMDAFPLSRLKMAAVDDLIQDEKTKMQFLFPFSIYHNRWSTLEKSDFKRVTGTSDVNTMMGAEMRDDLEWNIENYNVYDPNAVLPEHTVCEEYLMKIIDECQRDGIGVLVVYLPFCAEPQDIQSANSAGIVAERYGVPYMNMLAMDGFLDYATDLSDPGHLSNMGARKVTDYIGEWLSENADLDDHRDDPEYSRWEKLAKDYNKDLKELAVRSDELPTQVNALSLGKVSSIIFLTEDSPALQDPWFRHLVSRISGTDRIEEAAAQRNQYFMLCDKKSGTVYESVGDGVLENMQTSMGEMTYIPVEKNFRLLYLNSDEDNNLLYDDAHLDDDIQIITYDKKKGNILSHVYFESAHDYEIDVD